MNPVQARRAVHMLEDRLVLTQRRASRIVWEHPSTQGQTRADPDPDRELRSWLRDFSKQHLHWGWSRVHTVAVREVWRVNVKKIWRLLLQEVLRVPIVKREWERFGDSRMQPGRLTTTHPDHVWALDWQFDVNVMGRTI